MPFRANRWKSDFLSLQPDRIDVLSTAGVSRALLDEGFSHFGIEDLDPEGQIRQWLSSHYTPEAIRQELAIFGTNMEQRPSP